MAASKVFDVKFHFSMSKSPWGQVLSRFHWIGDGFIRGRFLKTTFFLNPFMGILVYGASRSKGGYTISRFLTRLSMGMFWGSVRWHSGVKGLLCGCSCCCSRLVCYYVCTFCQIVDQIVGQVFDQMLARLLIRSTVYSPTGTEKYSV